MSDLFPNSLPGCGFLRLFSNTFVIFAEISSVLVPLTDCSRFVHMLEIYSSHAFHIVKVGQRNLASPLETVRFMASKD